MYRRQRRVRSPLLSGQASVSPAHPAMHEIREAIDDLSTFLGKLGVRYERIRTELESTGETIRPNYLRIAPNARAAGMTEVNGEFGRVPGVREENWPGG